MRQLGRGVSAGEAGEGFWRFSLALYARPGIAEALIALQERAGYDVNLVLFALWAGAVLGVRLDAAGLAAVRFRGLRALRRRFAPAANGTGVEPEQVEGAAQGVVDHLAEALRLGVEGRHRRGDHGAHFR